MFKLDQHSLEELSFALQTEDLASLQRIIARVDAKKLSTMSEEQVAEIQQTIEAVAQIQLDGKFYAFHVEDNYAEYCDEGVEIYRRQGDILKAAFIPQSRDLVFTAEQATEWLKEQHETTVYTGPIIGEFLGLEKFCDPDDPINRYALLEQEQATIENEGITVVRLAHLI